MNLTITEPAVLKVKDLLIDEKGASNGLRIYVQGGGCSGFQYGFAFESSAEEDDFVVEQEGVLFYVDSISAQYLEGASIDFKDDIMGSHFAIDNPNATTTCGCGSSFSV